MGCQRSECISDVGLWPASDTKTQIRNVSSRRDVYAGFVAAPVECIRGDVDKHHLQTLHVRIESVLG